jgi:hypothetical protein
MGPRARKLDLMATTAEIIAQLEAGLAVGEAEVEYEGRRIKYRSIGEIQKAIAYFRNQAVNPAGAAGGVTPAQGLRTSFVNFESD